MSMFVRNIFIIAGTMMFSLLIFAVMFGHTGKSFMWTNMEPVFQHSWDKYTLTDGKLVNDNINQVYNSAVELRH